HLRALVVGERAGRTRARRELSLGLLRAVVARAAHAQRRARGDHPDERDQEQHALHHDRRPLLTSRRPVRNRPLPSTISSSVGSGKVSPNSAATFRCTSMTVFAFSSSAFIRSFSRWSRATSSASGFFVALRPRFFGVSPASSPASRSRRHVVRCDEY